MSPSVSSNRIANCPLLGAILFLLSLTGTPAYAETENCMEVPSVPYFITSQGLWRLKHDLTTTQTVGNAIQINANNVTLDLNRWKLGGQAAGTDTQTSGIVSLADNVTVKNGIVRGFQFGINLNDGGAKVEGMLLDQNTHTAISVHGRGAIVRTNQVVDSGGSTRSGNPNGIGIFSTGDGNVIEHNVITGLASLYGQEFGIWMYGNNSRASNNFITDTASSGTSYGIFVQGFNVHVDKNTVSNFDYCIYYTTLASGIYSRNTVTSCSTADYSFGTAGPGNAP